MAKSRPRFQEIGGMLAPPFFSPECYESALRFRPEPGAIFVASYPKCGTTWMQNLVLNVLRRARPLDRPRDFFLASPFLEQLGAEDSQGRMIRPGAYKTHFPFGKVPWSEDCKYIYVARNPKDCCVSFYHHMKQIPGYQFGQAPFDDFFDLFLEGDLEYNDYFDHLLSWYNERDRPNVLFTTFESMKRDLRDVVLRVARFLGANDLENDPETVERIVRSCDIENMQFMNVAMNSMYDDIDAVLNDPSILEGRKHIAEYVSKLPTYEKSNIEFVRKGEVGGWKVTFTKEQNDRMKERIGEKTRNSDVMSLWDGVM